MRVPCVVVELTSKGQPTRVEHVVVFGAHDENLHVGQAVMDEVFGRENFVGIIGFVKTSGRASKYVDTLFDHLLWYAR